ncbi:MAG: winged helix-turn-helix domain-containing protein [Candidatus Bathyarchaeota archaeon]|uniref:ArsR/SmtB family transcription factor n=1 Tax=Candidatus Bathycorpusculum sp. TaxID=2994959 RepID=UPI0028252078|nr:winged helix-turn-helix domain-containing protein [Candidatus Termiticorpusculum sp.]MCL2257403.1 winged helix-turn-helix domain-containing protein [Candidatus Termiticorpusculum sp.]MCL2292446.1 winged helix-turn-helix domain-containing protein [Candidatus Termiticorpusculum sp.]
MTSSPEDEIYSIMFSSFKHPIRRKILRMLDSKPMSFMELVEALGISTPNLTYHLESLGDLLAKLDNGQYKLSAFGKASVNTLKSVEGVPNVEPKHGWFFLKRRSIFSVMLITIIVLASFSGIQYYQNSQLSESQKILYAENQQLMSWGMGTNKAANFLHNVTHIDTKCYTVTMLSNTLQWRTDFGGVSEEEATFSLTSKTSNLNTLLRFRNGHFSRYELVMIESYPISTINEPNNFLINAHSILSNYKTYSGDAYLTDMLNLLGKVESTKSITVIDDNMKLCVTISGATAELLWMYTESDIDYQTKGLQMTFQNNVLITMTDGYFLFQKGGSNISVSQEKAVTIAENYVKTLTQNIEGKQVSGFKTQRPPVSVQMVPHARDNSVNLYPYWYVELRLDMIYAGGINIVAVGIYADTGQVVDAQLQRGSIEF